MTILERDPETGQITKSKITSEEARELQRLSRSKHISDKAKMLLASKGYNEDNPPPYYLELREGEECPTCGHVRGQDLITENDQAATYHRIMEYRDVSPVSERGSNHASEGQQQPPSSG
jgi:hypothetical protein